MESEIVDNNEQKMYQDFQLRMNKVAEKFDFLNGLRDSTYANYELFQTVLYTVWTTRANPEMKTIMLPMSLIVTIFERHYNLSSFGFEKIDNFETCFFYDGEGNKTKMESLSGMAIIQVLYSLMTLYNEEDQDIMHKVIISNINSRFGQIVDEEDKLRAAQEHNHEHGEGCSCGK